MRVRVLLLGASATRRLAVRALLQGDAALSVAGEAEGPEEALPILRRARPELATVDVEHDGEAGLDAIARLMAHAPLPILALTRPGPDDRALSAIRRGALELAQLPRAGDGAGAAALRAQILRLAQVPVVRHVAGSLGSVFAGAHPPEGAPLSLLAGPARCTVIGIGASAGGPGALAQLLGRLPADFPAGIVLVQHLPKGFTLPFAHLLDRSTGLRVHVVVDETRLSPGVVLVAPDDRHLLVHPPDRFAPSDGPPLRGHRPSIDALFESLADVFGARAVGVVLTGIGDDGTLGLARLRRCGALTIAQAERGCTVYGMPRMAIESGAAVRVMDLDDIAGALMEAVRGRGPPRMAPHTHGGRP